MGERCERCEKEKYAMRGLRQWRRRCVRRGRCVTGGVAVRVSDAVASGGCVWAARGCMRAADAYENAVTGGGCV